MKLVLAFDYDVDIIECPYFIVEDLKKYQLMFDKWLYDKTNNHNYWFYKNGEKYGVCYRSDAFVEWLNTIILKTSTEKAVILVAHTNNYDKNLPLLNL